jgi:hypothetical protein
MGWLSTLMHSSHTWSPPPQKLYPAFGRVITSESADKSASARFASWLGWTRFGVMYADDAEGRRIAEEWDHLVTSTDGQFALNSTMPGAVPFVPGLSDDTNAGKLALQEDANRMRSIFTAGKTVLSYVHSKRPVINHTS